MARYARTDFDWDWDETSNALLALVREAADGFAIGGAEPGRLTPDIVVATMLWFIARRMVRWWCRPPRRFFEGDLQPSPAHESLLVLAGARQFIQCDDLVDALTRVITDAAQDWTLGDPEAPDSRVVLQAFVAVLWERRLIPRPPSKQYPRGAWP